MLTAQLAIGTIRPQRPTCSARHPRGGANSLAPWRRKRRLQHRDASASRV